ncbi:transcription antitermination factor NusB [Oceanicella actignis]|uniref:Transcription antitermination protein NusB n=1 Tax=Oceanicella actignis TaxID=1189325 RepID=A0A1M7U089_9RHOB|nr:transcription antitermination factor NusB [Oceanicella actignis]SET84214.1 NusB antitermination factor [Oceanicella actignis]SHN76421.1 NusB antitermination factor [Oceanicella actignis]
MSAPTDAPEPPAAPEDRPDPRLERRLARSAARLAAVQALFQMEATGADMRAVQAEFETHRLGQRIDDVEYREADIALFRSLLAGAVTRQIEIDQITDQALVERWPLGRIDPTLRALFRAAGAELLTESRTPHKVVINEFVDVAKAFYPEGKEARFVNAVLDHMARRIRPDAFA